MADSTIKSVLSVRPTRSERIKDLPIANGQLIFIQDKGRIAFDWGGKRKFYNQVEILATDEERKSYENPENGMYYFIIDTAVLWEYQDEWIQRTSSPEEIIFNGTELPELGSANKLYVNRTNKNISVWDTDAQKYIVVGEHREEISEKFIDSLFPDM